MSVDFGHFIALIERIVFLADTSEQPDGYQVVPLASRPMPELMRRLRDVIAEGQQRRHRRWFAGLAGVEGGGSRGGSIITTASFS